MALEVDFVPFATAEGANVTAQSTYISESTTSAGFASGVASSADCNKAWRQGTVMGAALANFIANTLSQNVLDNGSLSTLITQLTNAVNAAASAEATSIVDAALAVLTLPFSSITGEIANGQVPQGAVTQFQSELAIEGGQISGAISVSAAITASSFNVASDKTLKFDIWKLTGSALDRLDLYRGVTYRLKATSEERAGLIAQEFAKARPESVHEGKDGKLTIDPMGVIAELVEMVREERDKRRALEARVSALETR
jgi:hypothetical protein